uniref:FGF-NA1 protein n=1 Tax=Phallusia mammillata TaxID=59560 RepID=A0A6F9DDF3_9ASCI|nr:FGF-NA1 protein [Phallusia mammillata]
MEGQQIASRDSTKQLSCCAITTQGRDQNSRLRGTGVFLTHQVSQTETTHFNTIASTSCELRNSLLQRNIIFPITSLIKLLRTCAQKPQCVALFFVFVLFCLATTADTAPVKSRRSHSTGLIPSPELDTTANATAESNISSVELQLAARRPEPAIFDASMLENSDIPTSKARRSSGKKNKGRKNRSKKGGKGKKRRRGGKPRKRTKTEILNKETERDILKNKSSHKSKGLQNTNSPRRQRLYQKEGRSYHLAVLPNGKVKGEPSDKQSNYTILEIQSVQEHGVVTIRGAATGRYICVTKQGKVKAKIRYQPKQCNFTESILSNNQNTYKSLTKKCKNCFLSMKRNGKVPKIKNQNPNSPKTHFLPRSAQAAAYKPAEITIQVTSLLPSSSTDPVKVFATTSSSSKVSVWPTSSRDTGKRSKKRPRKGRGPAKGGKPSRGHSTRRQQAGGKRSRKEIVLR